MLSLFIILQLVTELSLHGPVSEQKEIFTIYNIYCTSGGVVAMFQTSNKCIAAASYYPDTTLHIVHILVNLLSLKSFSTAGHVIFFKT